MSERSMTLVDTSETQVTFALKHALMCRQRFASLSHCDLTLGCVLSTHLALSYTFTETHNDRRYEQELRPHFFSLFHFVVVFYR